jgi:MoxR-like ATPase
MTDLSIDLAKPILASRYSNPALIPSQRAPLLEPLGLIGFEGIEAPILAALATDKPLLLIGPHGTAKSLLLTRIAQALKLDFRHYNASLLNFDDLIGFPLPGPDGRLDYVRTPAAIWGAGAVIFDEISRCRPDIQNKLFPIIHERKVQGIALEDLRYRWAAMNPPCIDDDDASNTESYLGSEPLDAALADRFAFVVEMPAWRQFSERQRLAIIRAENTPVDEAGARALADAIVLTRQVIASTSAPLAESVANYVQAILPLLAQARLELSPRRANLLYQVILSVIAAGVVINPAMAISDATLLALKCALPHRAQGIAVPEIKILAAHKEAVRLMTANPNDPLRAILLTTDSVQRLRVAVCATSLPKSEFSRVVADTLAELPPGAREAGVVHLFETGSVGRLVASVASDAGETYAAIAAPKPFSETVHASQPRLQIWKRITTLLARLNPADARAHLQANALASLFARKALHSPEDAERAFQQFETADKALRSA